MSPIAREEVIPAWAPRRASERNRIWERLAGKGLVWSPPAGFEKPYLDHNLRCGIIVSWPEEWTLEHWCDAALHVLDVEAALRAQGWTLAVVRAQRVQFQRCRPVWISQAAMAPAEGRFWPGWQGFLEEFLRPLEALSECTATGLLACLTRWRRSRRMLNLASRRLPAERGEDLRLLRATVEHCVRGRRWSPWQMHCLAAEPAGLAGIVVKEEARLRRAALVYEWRQAQARGAKLAPLAGTAWVRLHACPFQAAADYLEEHAAGGAALPLVERGAHRALVEADLGVVTGAGNGPSNQAEAAALASKLHSMVKAAVVEFIPSERLEWEAFRQTFSVHFHFDSVIEAGSGRRICVLERKGPAPARHLVA